MRKTLLKKKERRRSTNLELLGGVSLGALRTLRDIASRADLPLERVFRDVVAIGLSVVSDPDESPYSSLIAFRAGLANKQAELENAQDSRASLKDEVGREFKEGEPERESLLDRDAERSADVSDTKKAIIDRSEFTAIRSGQFSENETSAALVAKPEAEDLG